MGVEVVDALRSMSRACSPRKFVGGLTQGFALGWDEVAPLALGWRLA